jgi:hypothetical protein
MKSMITERFWFPIADLVTLKGVSSAAHCTGGTELEPHDYPRMNSNRPDFEEELRQFEEKLPVRAAGFLRWVRRPSSAWLRYPLALLLVFGGIFGFLPILGLWMLPLGFILIAQDLPFLRPPMARLFAWINAKWQRKERSRIRV